MKITGLVVVFSIIAVAMQSCQKEEVDDPMDNVYNISFSRNALEYVNIPVGKYFVYKVPGYTALDSVVVTNNELQVINFPRNNNTRFPEHNIERFRLTMTQYVPVTGGTAATEWLRAIAMPDFFSPYDSSSTADVKLTFNGSFKTIFYAGHALSGTQTLEVEGVTYTGVIKAESDNGLAVSDPSYEKNIFYWARGIGIIKRIRVGWNGVETVRNLLRHN